VDRCALRCMAARVFIACLQSTVVTAASCSAEFGVSSPRCAWRGGPRRGAAPERPQVYEEGTHVRLPWFEWPTVFDIRTRPMTSRSYTGTRGAVRPYVFSRQRRTLQTSRWSTSRSASSSAPTSTSALRADLSAQGRRVYHYLAQAAEDLQQPRQGL
jgi:hypothetical protein